MYIKSLLLILIALAGLNGYGQDETWTDNLFTDSRFTYLKVSGYDANGFFVVGSNLSLKSERERAGFVKRKYAVAYYTDDLQKQWEQYLDFFDDEKLVAFTDLTDQILFLYTREIKKEKKTEVYGMQIGAEGSFNSPVLITTLNLVGNNLPDDFNLNRSKDNKSLILSFRVENGKEETSIHVMTFTDSLKTIFDQNYIIPFGNKNYHYISQAISNDGRIFILGSNNPLNRKIKDPTDLKYFLLTGSKINLSGSIIDISLPDKFISDIGLVVDELNNNAVVAGYYSEENPYSYAGIFYSAYDMETGKMKQIKSDRFPEKVLVKIFGEIKGKKNRELNAFSIDKIILRNDGGAVVLSEARYITSNSYYDSFTRSYITHTNYFFNNILVVSMNGNGNIDWPVVVPKNQATVNDGGYYSSYCMAVNGNKMHFVYNRFSGSRSNGMMYSVSATGEEQPTQLFGNQEEATLIPSGALQIDDDVIIIPAVRKRKMNLLKLTF